MTIRPFEDLVLIPGLQVAGVTVEPGFIPDGSAPILQGEDVIHVAPILPEAPQTGYLDPPLATTFVRLERVLQNQRRLTMLLAGALTALMGGIILATISLF